MAKKRYWTYEAKKKKVLKQDKWVATLRRQDHWVKQSAAVV